MANDQFRVDERQRRDDGAAPARERQNPIDCGVIGRIMFAVKNQLECNTRGMPPWHAYVGSDMDSYRGGGTERDQCKSRSPDHVPGHRFE